LPASLFALIRKTQFDFDIYLLFRKIKGMVSKRSVGIAAPVPTEQPPPPSAPLPTVILLVAVRFEPSVVRTVIRAVPSERALTVALRVIAAMPPEASNGVTVATDGLSEVHVTEGSVALSGVMLAVRVTLPPTERVWTAGETESPVTTTGAGIVRSAVMVVPPAEMFRSSIPDEVPS